ncbi:MAG: 23S rRNA (pseudouridine(1915)-N(3))-methyltransferase RlmH [Bacilli bacterium]|nr:23S rRNA (pseudouridine(1915)-N(3))-methyltransferase RlmH [Bacilli bacterium]
MIKIICLGKIKEKYLRDAINDYEKRLSKYTKVKIIELDEFNTPDIEKNLSNEAINIKKNINSTDYIITLEIDGELLSSTELSNKINNLFVNGNSNIVFIIGSSNGISNEIKELSNYKLSFSKFTFPHQLFRLIFMEQLYRSFKIINNEIYHK